MLAKQMMKENLQVERESNLSSVTVLTGRAIVGAVTLKNGGRIGYDISLWGRPKSYASHGTTARGATTGATGAAHAPSRRRVRQIILADGTQPSYRNATVFEMHGHTTESCMDKHVDHSVRKHELRRMFPDNVRCLVTEYIRTRIRFNVAGHFGAIRAISPQCKTRRRFAQSARSHR